MNRFPALQHAMKVSTLANRYLTEQQARSGHSSIHSRSRNGQGQQALSAYQRPGPVRITHRTAGCCWGSGES
jgi:hypothetical protein